MRTCRDCIHDKVCPTWNYRTDDFAERNANTCKNYLPAADVVSRGLFEQIKWERDIAMEQLKEYGISFGAKKSDDVVKVTRCKDCKWSRERNEYEMEYLVEGVLICTSSDADVDCWNPVFPEHSCSYGKRKE